jgi:glycosyltransferase involved in cell wall biosynthesis/GT2 family glycosyltransferase
MNKPRDPIPGSGPDNHQAATADAGARPPENAAAFVGMLEVVTEEYVGGWVCNARDLDVAIGVELMIDDRPIAAAVANLHREDLRKAGVGRGDHGFLFNLRMPRGTVNVRVAGSNSYLKRHASVRDDIAPSDRAEPSPSSALAPTHPIERIRASGLFDRRYYLRENPDVASAGVEPLDHYGYHGYREERRPNFYFDKHAYAKQLSDSDAAELEHHLIHYIESGERRGLNPSILFDVDWYRETYELGEQQSPLAHYLAHCRSRSLRPIPEFDSDYYLGKNPDVKQAGIDPFEHFFQNGWAEGRDPSPGFDTRFYVRRHLGGDKSQNPFEHYLLKGRDLGLITVAPMETTWASEIKKFTSPGPLHEDFTPHRRGSKPRAKILAYYLPQFHAFPENDLWWGNGFTEWTNVIRGTPRFKGHHQPRAPRDLGFYNLLSPGVMQRQIEMARDAGVFGFVFYFYAFGKRRLMEAPLENFLADSTLDFPFCLMWANESWTRTWDGISTDVLIAQNYLDEDDDGLVATWARHFRDPRYIRVQGRPVLMIYRPGIVPGVRAKVAAWRKQIVALGEAEPIFVMAQGFGDSDPRLYGFDGAIEFPPHKVAAGLESIADELETFDPAFSAAVFPFDKVVERSVSEPAPAFPLIKAAFPSWDNDARRQGGGMTIQGSTPAGYQAWLETLVAFSRAHPFFGENFVGVNAWNEWAEGAYLEPDAYYGAAYLNATARAVLGTSRGATNRICLVGHDTHAHGAQMLLKNIASTMRRQFGLDVEIVVLDDGKLLGDYLAEASTTVAKTDAELKSTFKRLRERGFRQAILNSTASSRAARWASEAGLDVVLLVHELPSIITEMRLAPAIADALPFVERYVFPADFVRRKFLAQFELELERTRIRSQGSYRQLSFSETARRALRATMGIGRDDLMALGVGHADLRKGFDLFLQAWRCSERRGTGAHFVWVGEINPILHVYLSAEIETAVASGRFHAVPFTSQVGGYYSAADVFLLTSREDPFPTVVLEALQCAIPTIAFEGSGGIPEMLRRHGAGVIAPMADVEQAIDAFADLRVKWAREPRGPSHRLAKLARDFYGFPSYAFDLLSAGRTSRLKISVVVPNYNYAHHLKARLASIFEQTAPIYELIVLDDGSSDSSLAVLEDIARTSGRAFQVVPNAVNSGSVFRQWRKAAELASGDFLWIAEADDMAAPAFLERLAMKILDSDDDFSLAYADSQAVDENDVVLSPSYKPYYRESAPGVFEKDRVFDGDAFVRDYLSERNLILNVSSCLWRRSALLDAMQATGEELSSYRLAGDWHLYVTALRRSGGKVAYVAEPLNIHRRHATSVTHSRLTAERHIEEIRRVQTMVRDLYPMDTLISWRQDAYLAEVARQLRAAEAARATLESLAPAEDPETSDATALPPEPQSSSPAQAVKTSSPGETDDLRQTDDRSSFP